MKEYDDVLWHEEYGEGYEDELNPYEYSEEAIDLEFEPDLSWLNSKDLTSHQMDEILNDKED